MNKHAVAIAICLALQPVAVLAAKSVTDPEDQPRSTPSAAATRPERSPPKQPVRAVDAKTAAERPRQIIEPHERSARRIAARSAVEPEDAPRKAIDPKDRPRNAVAPEDKPRKVVQPEDKRATAALARRTRSTTGTVDEIFGPMNRTRVNRQADARRLLPESGATPQTNQELAIAEAALGRGELRSKAARERWRALAEELVFGSLGECVAKLLETDGEIPYRELMSQGSGCSIGEISGAVQP
jgi:hypothetical protein